MSNTKPYRLADGLAVLGDRRELSLMSGPEAEDENQDKKAQPASEYQAVY